MPPDPRIPPNQSLAAPGKWPVIGERAPRDDDSPWTLTIDGLARNTLHLTLDELRARPMETVTLDIHCVTRWSRLDMTFRGVRLAPLLAEAMPLDDARFISFGARSARGHETSLALQDANDLNILLALEANGKPLAAEHGGPLRVVTPGRYFYKSVKWLERIELLADDRLGYWEREAGYHNHADPWREERYLAATLSRSEMAEVLRTRDFTGRDLRSISASDRDLTGLHAENALLRDADFCRAVLNSANFRGAQLSNAHFAGADLADADFTNADLEGVDFTGTNLRGANLTGASLVGTTFCAADGSRGATLDANTRIDPRAKNDLTPDQSAWLQPEKGSDPFSA